ncbi:hypothetical protein PIB30_052474 [Stylosanthes scabra]|uniref:Uncharacterized protein n=1 Tax=Stylosanthes scabra TaxID=79078 RepID=A0ABU6RIK0_9FABA|nr:hypothetical protein [Stylosanthes scabra]
MEERGDAMVMLPPLPRPLFPCHLRCTKLTVARDDGGWRRSRCRLLPSRHQRVAELDLCDQMLMIRGIALYLDRTYVKQTTKERGSSF